MTLRTKLAVAFLCGIAAGAGLTKHLLARPKADAGPAEVASLGVVPPHRESLVVLKHILETRSEARDLKFLAWWPPEPVADNPVTHEPAARVRVVWQNQAAAADRLESHQFYVKGDRVLGGEPDPVDQAGLRYARVQPAQGWSVGVVN